MTDVSDLEWYVALDIDCMDVDDLATMMKYLSTIGNKYDVGSDESEEGIQLVYENGTLRLFLNQILDCDMPKVIETLIGFNGLRITEIFHECLSRRFYKKFELVGIQMLDVYEAVLKQFDFDSADVWEYWKDESGFYDFVKEVYDDE